MADSQLSDYNFLRDLKKNWEEVKLNRMAVLRAILRRKQDVERLENVKMRLRPTTEELLCNTVRDKRC